MPKDQNLGRGLACQLDADLNPKPSARLLLPLPVLTAMSYIAEWSSNCAAIWYTFTLRQTLRNSMCTGVKVSWALSSSDGARERKMNPVERWHLHKIMVEGRQRQNSGITKLLSFLVFSAYTSMPTNSPRPTPCFSRHPQGSGVSCSFSRAERRGFRLRSMAPWPRSMANWAKLLHTAVMGEAAFFACCPSAT